MLPIFLAAAVAATSFNLVCDGTTTTTLTLTGAAPSVKPLHDEFRIDTQAQRWCRGACSATSRIFAVSPSLIAFIPDGTSAGMHERMEISRDTNQFLELIEAEGRIVRSTGVCSPAAFSGFPAKK